jgi:hypothetical protein
MYLLERATIRPTSTTESFLFVFFCIILSLFASNICRADWTVEHGSLRGFLLGDCPQCAYDNWTSHITEGVALTGYNDYGPSFLDPQTNGFGHFSNIPDNAEGDTLLTRWGEVFDAVVDQDWNVVKDLLVQQENEWFYDLIELSDDSLQKTFFIIRERLDSSFTDTNGTSSPDDDVIGGFRNSWGLYIFNPGGTRLNIIIEVVHPQDDFLAIPVALELFLHMDARALLITSAGREVCWDSLHPPYTNNKSLSDPSRNGRHPYQKCHEVLIDRLDFGPTEQLVTVQMHSYDTALHVALADAHVTATCSDNKPNPPIRDEANHQDLVNLLPYYPVDGLSADSTLRQRVDRYISLWCDPRYAYYTETGSLTISSYEDLCGYGGNQQALYSHAAHNGFPAHDIYVDPENFIHVELDEYPDGLWTPQNPQWSRWLAGGAPATSATFDLALEYYEPFIVALDSALWYSHAVPDSLPPEAVSLYQVTQLNESEVYLRWSPPAADPSFETYMLFYDSLPVTAESPYRTRTTSYLWALRDYHTTASVLKDLPRPPEQCWFAVGSRDIWGNVQPPCSSWQITDGMLTDVTARMLGCDTLELNWSSYDGDSLYHVYRQTSPDSAFTFFLNSDTNQVWIMLTDTVPRAFFQVHRILKL